MKDLRIEKLANNLLTYSVIYKLQNMEEEKYILMMF